MRIGLDVADIDAFGDEGFAQEAAHMLIADAREHRDAQTQPRRANSGIGRRSAEIFRKARHVLEAAADLLAVEIDGGAAHRDQVESAVSATPAIFLSRTRGQAMAEPDDDATAQGRSARPANGTAGSAPRPARNKRREFREWAKRIVGDDDQRNVAFRDIGGNLHHIGRIILED